jgi:aminocarboxymuconate-semialdehyde decarboxylase
VFGGVPATHAGFAFYDLDKIVFASDCPFDPEKGTMYTRETLRIIEGIDMPAADKEKGLARQSRTHHGREVQS